MSEVCLSIVEGISVYVVAEKFTGDVNYLPMHPDSFPGFFIRVALPSNGV